MIQFALWPILAVIMGIALLIGSGIVATIVWCTAHLATDLALGAKGDLWCPVLRKSMRVTGTPRRAVDAPFTNLRRCERWGEGPVKCAKFCLLQQAGTAA